MIASEDLHDTNSQDRGSLASDCEKGRTAPLDRERSTMIGKALTLTALSMFAVLSAAPADAGRLGDRLRDKAEALHAKASELRAKGREVAAKLADKAESAAEKLTAASDKINEILNREPDEPAMEDAPADVAEAPLEEAPVEGEELD